MPDPSALASALPPVLVDIPSAIERACRVQIQAGQHGTLTKAAAEALVDGREVVRSFRTLSTLPLDRVTPLIRHVYTQSVCWALFTSEYFDSLGRLIKRLTDHRGGSTRVLEVCAGSGVMVKPMRERGIEWTGTDASPPSATLSDVTVRTALTAVQEAVGIDVVFFAWWSKPRQNKRRHGKSSLRELDDTGDAALPEDRRLVDFCVAHGIPVVFVSENEGGITGSPELWHGDYQVQPAKDVAGEDFVDVTNWVGFSDRTWVILPSQSVIS